MIGKLGHVHTQTVVMLAFGVRFLLYSLLRNPWLVLPMELLNGLTFGLFYANMVGYASAVAPPGKRFARLRLMAMKINSTNVGM